MAADFQLIDFQSQAVAVQRFLKGKSHDERIAWMRSQGTIIESQSPVRLSDNRVCPVYCFESPAGLRSVFFFRDDQLVFCGDNHTYVIDDDQCAG
jgi:NAD-dependent dihydropyrimidine dehydrogenase PreA subunit